jgi:hypothetical protein
MTNQHDHLHWPAQLQKAYDHFKGTPEELLEKGYQDITNLFEPSFRRYAQALESILSQTGEASGDEVQRKDKQVSPVGTFLDRIDTYLEKFTELPLDQISSQLIETVRSGMISVPAQDEYFSRDLDLNFWKTVKVDNVSGKVNKFYTYHKLLIKGIFKGKAKSKKGFYGTQKYRPDLFFQHYYVFPVTEKIFTLLGEVLLEQVKAFHDIHGSNETFVKDIVNAEQANLQSPGNLNLKLIEIIKSHMANVQESFASGEKHDAILKDLKSKLEAYTSQRESLFNALIHKTGTGFLPGSAFSAEQLENRFQHLGSRIKDQSRQWNLYFNGEQDDWIKDLDLLKFNHLSVEMCANTRAQLLNRITANVLPALEEAAGAINTSLSLFMDLSSASDVNLKDNVLKESRSGLRKLRREKIPLIIDLLSNASIPKIFSNFSSQLKYRISSFEDEYRILKDFNLEKIPPRIRLQKISLKRIIETEYATVFDTDFKKLSSEVETVLNNQFRTLNEIGQIIEFNIETALELLDGESQAYDEDDVRNIITGGLERAAEVLGKISDTLEKDPAAWIERLMKMVSTLNAGVIELLDNEKILNLMIREARAEASTKFRRFRDKSVETIKRLLTEGWYWFSYGLTGAKTGYRQFSRLTGQLSLPELEKELMDMLFTTRIRIEKLPYVYQRLYRLEPLTEPTLFGGRENEIEAIESTYHQWKSGNFANTVIIGEKGAGRTTLLNLASKAVGSANPLYRIYLHKDIDSEEELLGILSEAFRQKEITSFEQLCDGINQMETPVTCIVEDMHFLFLRTIDGFDSIERFLWLISQTQRKVFWVVSIGYYCWNFLDATISINRYFHHMIYLSQLEAEQIREIILKRHRISGYGLEFIPNKADLNDRRYKNLRTYEEQQAYLDNEFFKELHSITTGNISVAFMLWQLSVEEFKKDKALVRSNMKMETGFLSDLPEEELFTLEGLLEHEILTIEEHAVVFGEREERSSQILYRMKNKGLLVETEAGFQIHFLLYKPVVKVMKSKNILK